MTKPKAFVAYSSKDPAVADIIFEAVHKANALPIPVQFEPWPFNDVPGAVLISPILEKIDESPFIVADITYLNLNVLYEIGFAVGKGKRAFLVRSKNIEGDKVVAKQAGIFDTLGYHEFESADDLKSRLAAHIEDRPLAIPQGLDRKAPIYIVEPPVRGEAIAHIVSRVKKAGFRYRSFNPGEDVRLSATDAIRQIASSSGVVIPLQDSSSGEARTHNIRAAFTAGLAEGMRRPTLLLAPAGYEAPLDFRDSVAFYKHPHDIAAAIAEFCPRVVSYLTQLEPTAIYDASSLRDLSIGDPTAENEMTTLQKYFLKTDQYQRALRGEVNLVVGRKGSGKTALFISVRDKIRSDKRNIVVDLKPEGYQLIKLKEDILSYLSEGARQHLITAFWEYLILLEVAYKLLEKDQYIYKHNHEIYDLYLTLQATYRKSDFASEGDFSERLLTLSQKLASTYREKFGKTDNQRLTSEDITELLHSHDLRKLIELISEYLKHKESVWILFDNLDKGWSTQGVEVIDTIVLRCLIDAGRKVEREMRRDGHAFNCIIFVRNDVYDHLMKNSADYGKEMRATLDWTDVDLLKEMLRLRFVSGLDGKVEKMPFENIWPQVCVPHFQGEETSAYFIERCLMRPRNLLKIFNHCRGFATNFSRQKIDTTDIDKGLRAYSQDLVSELDHELTDVFPTARSILYKFVDAPSELTRARLFSIIGSTDFPVGQVEKVVEFLLYYGVIGIRSNEKDHFIYDVNYNLKMLEVRANREGDATVFVINPAFWPALGIVPIGRDGANQQDLLL
ncbi:MAG: hypothetical protein KG075_04875 [Alphaproteobacteria bacterium]|nr:hypothetical protein [Alphaproteobacteria bacterium]